MASRSQKRKCSCGKGLYSDNSSGKCKDCLFAVAASANDTAGVPFEGLDATANNAVVTKLTSEKVRSLDDLIRVCDIDLSVWDVERFICNKWEVGAKIKQGNNESLVVTPLFQVKAWLRLKVAIVNATNELAQLKADALKGLPAIKSLPAKSAEGDLLLQISIPDVHMGKMAWKPESGENYDMKIAERLFEEALLRLIERTKGHKFGKVLFVVGNDLLHTDNPNGTTTRGTAQDTDGRFHKTFWKTRKMVTRCIDKLKTIAPVTVLMVPGNHDTQSLWHLGDSLECWFWNDADVYIDNAPTQRKYFEHGKVMLMFTHGDKGKQQNYPLLMATEQPEMFGRTKHREAHTGHIHQLQVREQHGVRVRVSPALCAADAWHAENQYVGNARAAEAFVWSPEEGLMSQATWTVPE